MPPTYPTSVIRRAEQILGYGITSTAGERQYKVVDGVIYTDLFTGSVTIPDYNGTFTLAFNGKVNGQTYYNEIHLDSKCKQDTVKLTLSWGSNEFLTEITDLLEWLKDNTGTDALDQANVESKKIEDFNVKYRNTDETAAATMTAISDNWGYYIRRPLIIGVSKEQRNDWRYF